MGKNIESLSYLMLIWGIPAFMVVRAYLKMNPEDKKSAMSDFKSLRLLFTLGLLTTGGFFNHAGTLFSIRAIEVVGAVLFIVGGVFSVISLWNNHKVRSVSVFAVVSLSIFLYFYWELH